MPQVAETSGVSLRTVYRYYPTREQLLEAAGRWIGSELLRQSYPQSLDEIADSFEPACCEFDRRPGLVRAMALSQLDRQARSRRRSERLQAIRKALADEVGELSDRVRSAETDGSYFCFEVSTSRLSEHGYCRPDVTASAAYTDRLRRSRWRRSRWPGSRSSVGVHDGADLLVDAVAVAFEFAVEE